MITRNPESGAVSKGVIIFVAIAALVVFLVIKIGPITWSENAISAAMDDVIPIEGARLGKAELVTEVIGIAKDNDVELTEEQVEITYGPEPNQINVTVSYPAEADLIVTTYEKDVEIEKTYFLTETMPGIPGASSGPSSYSPPPSEPSAPSGPPPNPAGPYPDRAREAGKKMNQDPDIPE